MKITLHKSKDKDWLYRLNEQAYKENVIEYDGEWDEEKRTAHYDTKFDKYFYQLIRADDDWVGFVGSETTDTYIYLSDLKIIPEFQSKGIGSKIIKDLLSKAKQADLSFKVDVHILNTRAISFYEALGLDITNIDGNYVYLEAEPSNSK